MNKKKPLSLLILLVSIVLVFFGVNIDLSSFGIFDSSYQIEVENNHNNEDSTIDSTNESKSKDSSTDSTNEPAIDSDDSSSNDQITNTEPDLPSNSSNLPDSYTEYDFRSDELLHSHYEKHKDEFGGNLTIDEYFRKANYLVNQVSSSVITKTEKDGDALFFDTLTGEFGVLSTDGYIRTYFIPEDGIDYYNRK